MKIEKPGQVAAGVLFLGTQRVASFLVMGESYALVGGGVAWGVERLERQLDQYRVDRARIRYLVISHAHHDHCGAVAYLRRRYPHLQLVASRHAAKVLGLPGPVALMAEVNRKTLQRLGRGSRHAGTSLELEALAVDRVVGDGDRLSLGAGKDLEFLNTPGHSRCSLAAYLPQRQMLFPGDAVPFPEPGRTQLTVAANDNFDEYLASLEKLKTLPLQSIAYEHGGVMTGGEARGILGRGVQAALQQRERIRKRYRELQSLDLLVEEMARKYCEVELFRSLSADVLQGIARRMACTALGLGHRA